MLGTIVNTICIITGSIVGSVAKKGIKEKYQKVLFTAMGMAALGIGFNTVSSNLPKSEYPVLFIVSLAVGSVLGTALNIDQRFKQLTSKITKRKKKKATEGNEGHDLAQGLSTGLLLYCIGTLSMVGPVMSALYGDNTFLYTNATLDLVTSAVLATTYGIGMILAAPVLFLWQGSIYYLTVLCGDIIPDPMITEISIVGGLLIAAMGLNILDIKDCKTLNLLPSLFIPVIFFAVKALIF